MKKIDTSYDIILFDTETTGDQESDRLCQLAYKNIENNQIFDELFLPPVPISIASQAVHHITPKMVLSKPSFIESSYFKNTKDLFENPQTIVVAHNAKFDISMLKKEGIHCVNNIDTLKIVRYLDPEMKIAKHSLQYLRYHLELDNEIEEPIQAHDAKGDVLILEKLFLRLFKKMKEDFKSDNDVIEKMIEISKTPSLISKFTFGKYNGSLVESIANSDPGYLEWLLRTKKESGQDEEDWIYTLEYFLKY